MKPLSEVKVMHLWHAVRSDARSIGTILMADVVREEWILVPQRVYDAYKEEGKKDEEIINTFSIRHAVESYTTLSQVRAFINGVRTALADVKRQRAEETAGEEVSVEEMTQRR